MWKICGGERNAGGVKKQRVLGEEREQSLCLLIMILALTGDIPLFFFSIHSTSLA